MNEGNGHDDAPGPDYESEDGGEEDEGDGSVASQHARSDRPGRFFGGARAGRGRTARGGRGQPELGSNMLHFIGRLGSCF